MENIHSGSRRTHNAASWLGLEVAQLRNDLGDLEVQAAKLEEHADEQEDAAKTLIGVEKDVQHIREILHRIEELVTG